MLTDTELSTLLEDESLLEDITNLKRDFLRAESSFMDVGDDDFISLVLMTPSVGVALANGSISLFEDLSLTRKARNLSRGSYFLREDPINQMLVYLIDHFDQWEARFYGIIQKIVHSSLKHSPLMQEAIANPAVSTGELARDMLNTPYILIKFLAFMFLEETDDLLAPSIISPVELEKIKSIGETIGIGHLPIFHTFVNTFKVREPS